MSKTEGLLAGLLRYGTWLASAVIGLGLALSLVGLSGAQVVAVGVVLFIICVTFAFGYRRLFMRDD